MHIVIWTGAGLVLLAAFILVGRLIGVKATTAAGVFAAIWLIAALYNFHDGWANHGIPFVNEVAALVPIFGIPAAAAWFWSRRAAER